MCEIYSKLIIKTLERSSVFIINFQHIAHIFLVFKMLDLNKELLAGEINSETSLSYEIFHIKHFKFDMVQQAFGCPFN